MAVLVVGTLILSHRMSSSPSDAPSFPGAQGFGATTPGERGGKVLHVTNLDDSGPGGLRAALRATGPRIVVFDTGGTIKLKSSIEITEPYLTVAGADRSR